MGFPAYPTRPPPSRRPSRLRSETAVPDANISVLSPATRCLAPILRGEALVTAVSPGPGPGRGQAPCGFRLPPHVRRRLDDQPQLRDLVLDRERVALDGGGEAALRREAELVDVDVPARVLDPALQAVLPLELAALGRDQAEHDHLPRRDEPQRLEPARALVGVLEEEPGAVHLRGHAP